MTAFMCISWNVNGVTPSKLADLASFLSESGPGVDALVLLETHQELWGKLLPGFVVVPSLQKPLLGDSFGEISLALHERC